MEKSVFLEKLLKAYERYYSIKKENVQEPFDVEAEFVMHGEQYILVKAAKIATERGCDMIIMNGAFPENLYNIIDGKPIGTRFFAKKG